KLTIRSETPVTVGQRVKVYRNLNKPEFFSIMAADGPAAGRVLGYAKAVEIANVTFRISQKSRERLLRDKRRNVHAFAVGTLVSVADELPADSLSWARITYQPYTQGFFFDRNQPQQPVQGAG